MDEMMNSLDKAVRALECCIVSDETAECPPGCPFGGEPDCETLAKKAAMNELKPRMMTLSEVLDPDWMEAIYIESIERPGYMPPVSVWHNGGGTMEIRRFYAAPESLDVREYGKTWRCWTRRPTAKQAEAVKWDENLP